MTPHKVAWAIVKTIFTIVLSAVIMMLVYRFAMDAYDFGYRIFAEEPVSPKPGLTMSVAIVEGKSSLEIGEILKEKGLIRDAYLFYLQEMFSTYHKSLQPGVYELNTSMTPEEMMAVMASGEGPTDAEEENLGNSEVAPELQLEAEPAAESEGEAEPEETE